jgi:DNA-binding IclR family transcriptional regulator
LSIFTAIMAVNLCCSGGYRTTNCMRSGDRQLAVLKLFSAQKTVWTVDEASAALGVTVATTYRYFKSLVEAGLLTPVSAAGFGLGPAIIEYDRLIQASDPMLQAAIPVMVELIKHAPSASTILLARLYGEKAMCVHQVVGPSPQAPISYERGRPMPLLRGATSKIILAHMGSRALRRIYDRDSRGIGKAGLGASWEQFKANLAKMRRAGYCLARGEVDPGRLGVAAPVFGANREILGSLTFTLADKISDDRVVHRLITMVCGGAREIEANMHGVVAPEFRRRARAGSL